MGSDLLRNRVKAMFWFRDYTGDWGFGFRVPLRIRV